jgi:hypothetical protein
LDTGRGIGAEVISQTDANRFAKQEGESGGRASGAFFKCEAGGGKNQLKSRVTGAEPSKILAGGEKGAGVGDERIAFGEMHGLSKKRDSETRSEVL